MSKITATRKLRILDWDNVSKKVIRRPITEPAKGHQPIGNCHYCRLPVLVSIGQTITTVIRASGEKLPTHKKCRKNKR